MNSKRKTLLTTLIVALLVLTLSLFAACNGDDGTSTDNETTTEVEATEGLLISNSDFKVDTNASYDSYPLSPKGWTGASMYSSGSFPVDVIAGAVNLGQTAYDKNKSA